MAGLSFACMKIETIPSVSPRAAATELARDSPRARFSARAPAEALPAHKSCPTYRVGASRTETSICGLIGSGKLKAGDIIEVDAGTYHGACGVSASGNAGNPITLRGAPGTRPILDGTGFDLTGAGSTPRGIFSIQRRQSLGSAASRISKCQRFRR